MKSCPTCNRTYPDDTLAFCLMDGSVLSAPYDPESRKPSQMPRDTSPPRTEILTSSSDAVLPPTRPASPAPEQATISAPPPVPPSVDKTRFSPTTRKSLLPRILIAVGGTVVFTVLLVAIVNTLRFSSASRNKPKVDVNITSPDTDTHDSSTPQIKSACGHTLNPKIYDKWAGLGGETGKLGCPINDESDAPASPRGTTGRWIRFAKGDGGYLILHESGSYSGQVTEVSGCMFKLYVDVGGTKSWLGFPIGDGFVTSPGARQEFEGGYVEWDSKTYRCEAHERRGGV